MAGFLVPAGWRVFIASAYGKKVANGVKRAEVVYGESWKMKKINKIPTRISLHQGG